MKKILFSLSLLLCLTLGVQAQHSDCSKACTAKAGNKASCEVKVADAQTSIPAEYQMAAAKMASLDANIESRTNPLTGEVSYVRKQTCPHDGAVSFVALNFDPASSTFVNVSPSQMATGSNNTQSCGASKGTATSGKSCCAAGASTKACCADKAKSASGSGAATESKSAKAGGGN